jgi:hypothetical protein
LKKHIFEKGKGKYHGSGKRNTIDQTSGIKPRLRRQDSIEIDKRKRPLKEKFKPNKTNKEMWFFSNKIITIFICVPCFNIDKKIRKVR